MEILLWWLTRPEGLHGDLSTKAGSGDGFCQVQRKPEEKGENGEVAAERREEMRQG